MYHSAELLKGSAASGMLETCLKLYTAPSRLVSHNPCQRGNRKRKTRAMPQGLLALGCQFRIPDRGEEST